LEDLASIAGVSIATVSRALNNSSAVNDETKRRVWKIAREHNYNFRPSMPALLSGAAATIAVVVPTLAGRQTEVSDPFFQELISGLSEAGRLAGCDVLISYLAPKNQDDLASIMTANRAEGVIFLGQSFLHERFNQLAETESRFIGSDNLRGGKRATSHLLNLGRRRIAFVGDTSNPEILQRYEGYISAHRRADIPLDADLTLQSSFDVESAEAAISSLMERGVTFDAVFGANDLIALATIRSLLREGVRVPDDVSVIGYDDLQLSAYGYPALSTISQDPARAGRILVAKLIASVDTGSMRSERLPTELIVRESCGLS
jgi:DNA-binding LacI/PurR family transcriptional regulator